MIDAGKALLLNAVRKGLIPQEFSNFVDEVCEGAVRGLDVKQFKGIDEWVGWLSWSSVLLNEEDYLTAATHALWLAPKLAATDYGTARQRDLGQLWTDTIRGFLGEIAFVKWLKERFGLEAVLDFRKGRLEEFLPSDVKEVNKRSPKLNVSIKTTKLRGIWLDVPYAQIKHSDVFVLVRVGVTREHFLAFLKKVSAIGDKILKRALGIGIVTKKELSEIWDSIPEFTNVPAYVAGFLDKRDFAEDLEGEQVLIVDGAVRGRKNVRLVVNKFLGFWHPGDDSYKERLLQKYQKTHPGLTADIRGLDVEFEGIGGFSKTLHFIASSGVLKRKKHEWEKIAGEL
ncbi:MAG: hypothetical protein ACTSXC_08165 [Candidatus Freyarchaeota archaeon]